MNVVENKAVAVQAEPPRPTLAPALVPANMTEAISLANLMSTAKLVPAALQKSPADCLLVIQQAIRWQMDPFAVAQECSVIQGKLMHSGKLVAAVVNARGNLSRRLSFAFAGEDRDRVITVSGTLQGESAPRTVEVALKNASTNNKVWQTQPDQQLMYHGVRVWARRHTPELMLGVYSPEEFDAAETARAEAEAAVANGTSVMHPDDYADGTPEKLTKPPQPLTNSRARIAEIQKCTTVQALHDWGANHSQIVNGYAPDLRQKVYRAFTERLAELEQQEEGNVEPEDDLENILSISQRAIDARENRDEGFEVFNEVEWLGNLTRALASCAHLDELAQIKENILLPAKGKASPKTYQRGCGYYHLRLDEISKP